MHVWVCGCACVGIRVCMWVCMCGYVGVHVCMHVSVHVCVYCVLNFVHCVSCAKFSTDWTSVHYEL